MRKLTVLGGMIAISVACGHPRTAERPLEATASERAVQHPPHPVEVPSESIEAFMTDHFLIATFVRNGVIRGNLAFSLVYNLLVAGLALAGKISPLWAAVIMPLSSLTVVAHSYRRHMFRTPAALAGKQAP